MNTTRLLFYGALCSALLSGTAWGVNSVVVVSDTVGPDSAGLTIGIRITNDVTLSGVDVPLEVRTIDGAVITALAMSFGGRITGKLTFFRFTDQRDGSVPGMCKEGQAGGYGGVPTFSDGAYHPVVALPECARLSAIGFPQSNYLQPGADTDTGSLKLHVNVGHSLGRFEVDTTCVDPSNHLLFTDATPSGLNPSFTLGVILVGNTPAGSNLEVPLSSVVSLTFAQVTSPGHSKVTTSNTGPPPPSGFGVVPTSPPIYYDITTTATYTGSIKACIIYDPATISVPESQLTLWHEVSGSWVQVQPVTIDETANKICGDVTSLSPFIVAEPTCACDCHADPAECQGAQDVLDVVETVGVAFRGAAAIPDPNANCPREKTDVNCSGATDVLDVVAMVAVAFRGANAATEFCDPCP